MGRKKPNCDFCGSPAVWDGPSHAGPWAYACEEHEGCLTELRTRIPSYGEVNKDNTFAVASYMADLDTAYAVCECGNEQEVEPDAESGYCLECGAYLTFVSPIESEFCE